MTDRPYTPPPYPYRQPGEESTDLYPGLVVCDGRITGSITAGPTRLPLWAIPVRFDETDDYLTGDEGIDERGLAMFVHHLLQSRGEFGRLLLVLAEAERTERGYRPWWFFKARRLRVRAQLLRCLNALGPD